MKKRAFSKILRYSYRMSLLKCIILAYFELFKSQLNPLDWTMPRRIDNASCRCFRKQAFFEPSVHSIVINIDSTGYDIRSSWPIIPAGQR